MVGDIFRIVPRLIHSLVLENIKAGKEDVVNDRRSVSITVIGILIICFRSSQTGILHGKQALSEDIVILRSIEIGSEKLWQIILVQFPELAHDQIHTLGARNSALMIQMCIDKEKFLS